MRRYLFPILFLILAAAVAACAEGTETPTPNAQQPNPASVYCEEQGGRLQIETGPSGGQYGVCLFDDNRQCEEWAMYRGECPVGGVKVAGYLTDAARFCAISGGVYDELADSCTFNNGVVCPAEDFYNGTCSKTPAD